MDKDGARAEAIRDDADDESAVGTAVPRSLRKDGKRQTRKPRRSHRKSSRR